MQTLQWRGQALGARVLRAWLGVTFTYAGVQKLADPGFFTKGSRTYIGDQLAGFAHSSPLGPVLDLLGHAPVLAGAGVALTEIAIGVATLAGVAPSTAALGGVLLSVSLWLSASWHVHPYFLGSDSIYAVAWLAYLLGLPGTTATLAAARERRRPEIAVDDDRRHALRGGAVALGALAVAGVAGLVGHSRHTRTTARRASARASHQASHQASASSTVITTLSTLDAQGGVNFTDATVGAAVVCALAGGGAAAFSRICTHSGCTTSFDRSSGLIVCPCHGSRFDPAANGAVVNGPANRPLPSVQVVVDTKAGVVRQA